MKKFTIVLLALTVAAGLYAGGQKEAPKPAPAATPAPAAAAPAKAAPVVKNPDTFIYASYGDAESMDPARAYDNASGGIIQNIYETLVFYDGQATDKFVPVLAEQVPTVENGGITNGGKTYRFKIRKGVTFHSGNKLTPVGVRYSFLRNMLTDPDGGPMWMLYSPLLGLGGSRDGDGNIIVKTEDLEKAIQVDGDYVIFNLRSAFPPFLAVLSGYWAGIIDMEFVMKNGDWNGSKTGWEKWNGPKTGAEILNQIASGTGPYKLDRWEKGVETVMTRNESYWGKKPAMAKIIFKLVDEWSTRKLMLLQGDADSVQVDPQYYAEMNKEAGVVVYKDLTELGVRCINFNQDINAKDNPYVGSGKLDGKGIPTDFFADKNIRLAFAHAFDEKTYLNDILDGTGVAVATPHVTGLPYFDKTLKNLPYDLKKSAEYFKKAFGGKIWEMGFEFDFLYNTGNEVREQTAKLFAENIASINPKFKVNVRAIEWATFVETQRLKTMPIYYIGWGADYPHPDNFMYTYMHSSGLYAGRTGYKNAEADALLDQGQVELDPKKAEAIYMKLQKIWLEDLPGIALHQPITNRYFKDWVKGYQFHSMENQYMYSQFSK